MWKSRSVALDVAELTDESPGPFLTKQQVSARRWQLFAVGLVVVIIDQITKIIALRTLDDGPIEGPFGSAFRLIFNRGSAFSLGEGFGPIFGVLAIIVTIALFWIVRNIEQRSVVFGLGLVGGGAIGNVIDRAFREGSDRILGGAVIDFLEVGSWWPVFNIADVAIVVGGFAVALLSSR